MMNTDQLRIAAPAIFAESPVSEVTEKYTFIPTTQLLKDFEKLGWGVDRASQPKSRKDALHAHHRIILRNPALPSFDGSHPELIMMNSHDRTSAFKFMMGLFEFACLNGLVIGTTLESIRIRHMGYEFSQLQALTQSAVEGMPEIIKKVNYLKGVALTAEQQKEFAMRAIALRFKEYVDSRTSEVQFSQISHAIDVPAFLEPVRHQDDNDSVWSVFNRVQERLIKGGFQRIGTVDGISKRVRPVTNIKLDVDVNQRLWELAGKFAAVN